MADNFMANKVNGAIGEPGSAGKPSADGPSHLIDPPAAEETLPKQFGKYTLLKKLAAGGMAELFLALHRSVGGFEKLVVIKRILPQMNQDAAFIDMLVHEARIAATLSHPNIVQTFDVGQVDGTFFIAMEHIHGEDIRSIVRGMKKKSVHEFPLSHALSIIIGLCAGLAYAHEKRTLDGKGLGIVHRDISPQNIVVTFTGDIKVVDFGVAKSLHFHDDSKGGQLKGKVPYMSPEQAAGKEIDHRSDIFAAGVILFELTTGRRLFKGGSEYETLKLICEKDYPLPSDVAHGYPLALERVVMKALAKDPAHRYQTAREMQGDLETFIRNERIPVSTVKLASFMQMLFAEKVAEQDAMLSDVKALADLVAKDYNPDSAPLSSLLATGQHTAASTAGAVATIPPEKKRSSGPLIAALLLLVAVVGGVGFYLSRKPAAAPVPAPASTNTAAEDEKPSKGSLKITSEPAGAAIWINGDLREEVTPATIGNLPVGRDLQIKLSREGFESWKSTVKIDNAGDTKDLSAPMRAGSVVVELDIFPEPSVWVDGKPWKGSAKRIEGLSADEEHKIAVSASGHQARAFTFTGKQGETKKFSARLIKGTDPMPIASDKPDPNATKPGGTGTVRIGAKGGYCNVTVNGAALGPTPTQASVPAGAARVSCKPESGPSMSQVVKVEAGQTARVTFQIP
jgi:eukaryotic-like serine/threonine-protein kinase